MRISNRATRKSIGTLLAASGLMLAGAPLAAAEETGALPSAPQDEAWNQALAAPPAVAREMRENLRSDLRAEMVAALAPDSTVWRGALDGYRLAQQMREEMQEDMRTELIADLHTMLDDVQLSGVVDPRPSPPESNDPQEPVIQYGQVEVFTMPSFR